MSLGFFLVNHKLTLGFGLAVGLGYAIIPSAWHRRKK